MACTWYIYVQTVNNLTSPAPADVQIEPPTESQFQAAENSMERLRTAIADNKETTVEFTAADLNALFARDPDFEDLRGNGPDRDRRLDHDDHRERAVAFDSIAEIEKTLVQWDGAFQFHLRRRDMFSFDIKSAEAGGNRRFGLHSFQHADSFDESTSRDFLNELKSNDRDAEFWDHVKTMRLVGDKLVVTTKPE